jgi:hypothetical protein
MTKHFVLIDDPVHHLIRTLTHETPLCAGQTGNRGPGVRYQVTPAALPDAYFSLALLHAMGGMTLDRLGSVKWKAKPGDREAIPAQAGYFDLTKLDRRCCRDLRLRPSKRGPGMLSAELLVYGTGMLRARNDDLGEPIHQYLWRQYGRLQTPLEIIHARIVTLHRSSIPDREEIRKESFDSTNLIYGDAFGELEQLWDRRADTTFLDQIAASLRRLTVSAHFELSLKPPLDCEAVVKLHLQRQRLWRTPPSGARALLRRLEFILNNTRVESIPLTLHACPAAKPGVTRDHRPQSTDPGGGDNSGYDGWLAGNPGVDD